MEHSFKRVAVVGLGYVGLPTAALLASRGLQVIGVDTNPRVVETIGRGAIHIVEPDLDMLVHGAVATGNLRATTQLEPADAFIVAVPTPVGPGHAPDVSQVEAAARAIAPVLVAGSLVIVESTVPVGTTERVSAILAEARPDLRLPHQAGEGADVLVAFCPERVLPGRVLAEMVSNDRVIGGLSRRSGERAAALYGAFVRGECVQTDTRTAEMAKLVENAYRDVNVAFANEVSLLCERLKVDAWEMIRIANRHPRVNILRPGPGVGGHCIAVDPWFLIAAAPDSARLMRTAREVNDAKPTRVAGRIREAAGGLEKPVVACLGLTYKADVDDLRNSPAIEVIDALLADPRLGVLAADPHVGALPGRLARSGRVVLAPAAEAVAGAGVVALLVAHREFRALPRTLLSAKPVIDACGLLKEIDG